VRQDVVDGLVSVERAASSYGVVLVPPSYTVDAAATEAAAIAVAVAAAVVVGRAACSRSHRSTSGWRPIALPCWPG
jgi:hypothetical protein